MTKKLLGKVYFFYNLIFIFNLFINSLLAIKEVFSESRHNLCGWHVQKNLKSHFCILTRNSKDTTANIKKQKKDLYNTIINLPFIDCPKKFEDTIIAIRNNELLNEDLKEYLDLKYSQKYRWVKGYIKSHFCCGTCTSSRIESKHRVLKQNLNSSKRLAELFTIFQKLEQMEGSQFKDEFTRLSKAQTSQLEKSEIIKALKAKHSNYVLEITKRKLVESINYKIDQKGRNLWLNFV